MPSFWFKKLNSKKENDNTSDQKPRLRSSSSWRLHRMRLNFNFTFKSSILENLSFRVLSVVEAVVLVFTLSCFFLCCGCHF